MQENKQLLRFITAGSVDDGKSTLIGRLLYDSKSIFEDQLKSVQNTSKKNGIHAINLAFFTDGLRDEREQGITIDVAYRYFLTPKRKFIIADTPGHVEFTRNMITGASTANVIIVLIDARYGVVEQTKRHSFIASLLSIPHIIVCVNKMDLVDYSEDVFNRIINDYEAFSSKLLVKDIRFIPISALNGDNVVNRSKNIAWYQEAPLLHTLETMHISSDFNKVDARFPVQTLLRTQNETHEDHIKYAGQIASGIFRVDDEVTILPSKITSKIKSIDVFGKQITEAHAPMSIAISLQDHIDINRGEMIVRTNNQPKVSLNIEVLLCWLHNNKAIPNAKYTIRHTTNEQKAVIEEVIYKIDIHSLKRHTENKTLHMNDITKVKIRTDKPLIIDSYRKNKTTGSIILIDTITNETVAAGMII
ncbi:sulfate adenylyltransferase subunit 1 [Flavivirga spongiicola]|uniref:sulfate adenylyltransferase n=1 Tax=Flavivirga spongiicola TaxID=421621 RepID=A0ABU7XSP0_9FLAO|nr:GTP-binding protein [Flavivirga sp. MEBiC05379]MDO5977867.1 GTP-binding protein [Flavivirga sp. MEBiC05379]